MPTNPYNYSVTPTPSLGQTFGNASIFGLVPGQTQLPNPAADLGNQIPGLAGLNKAASDTIAAKLGGSISPGTMKALQDAAASYGTRMGMPGLSSGLALNKLFGDVAGFAEHEAQQGLADYNSFIPTVSGTQTVNPALQTSLSQANAILGAAPNPANAQQYAQQLFNNYLAAMRGPGGGTRQQTSPTAGTGTRGVVSSGITPGFSFNPPTSTGSTGGGTVNAGVQGLDQSWQNMIDNLYPELSGATPDQLSALGIDPWGLIGGAMSGSTGFDTGSSGAGDYLGTLPGEDLFGTYDQQPAFDPSYFDPYAAGSGFFEEDF